MNEPKTFLVQLHWQNMANHRETEFIAQGEFADAFAADAWATEIWQRRGSEMPTGWCPMICTQESGYFVLAAQPQG